MGLNLLQSLVDLTDKPPSSNDWGPLGKPTVPLGITGRLFAAATGLATRRVHGIMWHKEDRTFNLGMYRACVYHV
jgi:hypothetical protein